MAVTNARKASTKSMWGVERRARPRAVVDDSAAMLGTEKGRGGYGLKGSGAKRAAGVGEGWATLVVVEGSLRQRVHVTRLWGVWR